MRVCIRSKIISEHIAGPEAYISNPTSMQHGEQEETTVLQETRLNKWRDWTHKFNISTSNQHESTVTRLAARNSEAAGRAHCGKGPVFTGTVHLNPSLLVIILAFLLYDPDSTSSRNHSLSIWPIQTFVDTSCPSCPPMWYTYLRPISNISINVW
jgi:hypothetical protein